MSPFPLLKIISFSLIKQSTTVKQQCQVCDGGYDRHFPSESETKDGIFGRVKSIVSLHRSSSWKIHHKSWIIVEHSKIKKKRTTIRFIVCKQEIIKLRE